MSTNDFGFVPATGAQMPNTPAPPVPTPAQPMDEFGFIPSAGATDSTSTAPVSNTSGGGMGSMLMGAAGGALNVINNNPISKSLTSLAALPVQLGVKGINAVTGSHYADPYAGGIGTGPGAAQVTSSDQSAGQFAEQEAGNAANVGSLFLPAGKIAETTAPYLAPVLGKFAPAAARILTGTGVGAVQGVAGGMQGGQSVSDLTSSAKTGAIFGGGLSTAGELGSALISSVAERTGTTKLQTHVQSGGAAKTLTRAFNDTSTATTNPIQTLDQNGLVKDLRVIDSTVNVDHITNPARTGTLDNLIHDQQVMGTQAVEQMQGGIPIKDFRNAVIDSIKNNPALKASGQVGKMTAEIGRRFDDYAESYGETVPYKDINSIRIAMNKVWNPDTWDAEKAIGSTARSILYNGTGAGTTLKSAMQNEQELINAKEFLSKLNGTKVKGGALTKIIAESTAAAVGAGAGLPIPFVGPVVGAGVSAYAAKKAVGALQENYFSPMFGNTARSIKTAASTPAVSGAVHLAKSSFIPSLVQKK